MTTGTGSDGAAALMAKMQALWNRADKTQAVWRAGRPVEISVKDELGNQVALRGSAKNTSHSLTVMPSWCRLHLPPFDGIETPDPRRGGWVRMTCRHCGKFLGYAQR
jgi:hypothetical protein